MLLLEERFSLFLFLVGLVGMFVPKKEANACVKAAIYEETLLKVNEGYLNEEAFTFVAENRNISYGRVRNIYYEQGRNPAKRHGNCLLKIEEEDMIKGIVLAFSAVNMPLDTSQVLTLVETYLGRRVFAPTITDWLKLWSDEIRQRKTKCLGHKRIASEIVEHVDSFCVHLEEAIARLQTGAWGYIIGSLRFC